MPTVAYTGGATGLVDHAVFEAFWDEVRPALEGAIEIASCKLNLRAFQGY